MPDRLIRFPGGKVLPLDRVPLADRVEVERLLAVATVVGERNPLDAFEPHSLPQRLFLEAGTPVVAAQAGNRFGKTTMVVVKGGIQCLDASWVPERLRVAKRFDPPVYGWIVCPTEGKIHDTFLPAFRRWFPREALRGGSVDKAFNGEQNVLRFENGSHIALKTYQQAPDTLESAAVHWVGYDEPPPRRHREACLTRLLDFGGFEMFAYTPLESNTGYVKREIFKKRESPDITFVRGTMHDNPMLDAATRERVLATFTDLWRQAREFGDFVDVGGLIYSEFERCVVDALARSGLPLDDVVVGIDPGIRNAGIVFVAFDEEGVGTVFDELLLQDRTVEDYARGIWGVLDRWGVRRSSPLFVIDPAARSRGQVNAQSVQAALAVLGIGCADGQNAVEAGIQQVRGRLQHRRLLISRACVRLRDEADEYAAEDRPVGEFKPIKQNDHLLDALRYACMARPWFPQVEQTASQRNLGFVPGRAIPGRYLNPVREVPPMGSMS